MAVTVTGTPTTTDNAGGASSSTILVNVPAGAVVGEVLVCHIASGANNGAVTSPSGWTTLQTGPDTWGPTVYGTLAYRVVTGTEAASYTWTTASASNKYGATMFRVAGANTTTPFRSTALATANASGASSSVVTGPALTGVQASDEVFYFWAVGDTSSAAQPASYTMPSTPWTSVYSRGVSSKGTAAAHALGNQSAPSISGGTTADAYVVIGAAVESGTVSGSGSFAGAGAGTLTVSGSGSHIGSGSFAGSGAGTLGVSGVGTATGSGSFTASGAGTLNVSGTGVVTGSGSFDASGSGTITVSGSGTSPGAGSLNLSGDSSLDVSGTGTGIAVGGDAFDFSGTGTLTMSGSGPGQRTYRFQTPVMQRRMPVMAGLAALINYSPALLRIDGQWVEAEFPSEQQIVRADIYLPGGYELVVDHDTASALVSGGFTVPEWDGPLLSNNLVGIARVGFSVL